MKDVLNMPLSKKLGITFSTNPDYLVEIDFKPEYANHLGFFHASIVFSFAEICSGCFLAKYFPEEKHTTFPILRKIEGKFSNLAKGTLYAKAHLDNDSTSDVRSRLSMNGKVSLAIIIDVFDTNDTLVYRGQFSWFIRNKEIHATSLKRNIKIVGGQ